ncbi:MAG: Rieske 2Fe-2S domain-containing protein [Cyanobacteria bacterium P01_D01_bin.105]
MKVTSLGHSGLKIETKDITLLVDPWLSPEGAFLASWFQYPDNHHVMTSSLLTPTAVAISHEHLDHIDPWFLAQLPKATPIIIPKYSSPVLMQKIIAVGLNNISEVPQWEVINLGEGTSLFFVSEESPMNHDSAMAIQGDGEVLLNPNDARLSITQLRSIKNKVGGSIDLLTLQAAGASWYPICYDYPAARQIELSRTKRIAKLNYVERVISAIEPSIVVPFAGPPCFLDPELSWANNEITDGIFPDQQQVIDWLGTKGISNTTLLLPGEAFDLTQKKKQDDPMWQDFSFSDHEAYIQQYAQKRAPYVAALKARYPEPEASLWHDFQAYFQRLLSMSPYFNTNIGMRVGFEIQGTGGGQWAVDFRPGMEGVFDEMGECSYGYRFHARWLPPLLSGELPWEDFFLSLRFQAWREPDIYNDHLLGLLKFACKSSLKAVEEYETTVDSQEQITIHAQGKAYRIQRHCPHAGVDLEEAGEVLPGGTLRCLGHHYEFDLETGQCTTGKCKPLKSKRIKSLREGSAIS